MAGKDSVEKLEGGLEETRRRLADVTARAGAAAEDADGKRAAYHALLGSIELGEQVPADKLRRAKCEAEAATDTAAGLAAAEAELRRRLEGAAGDFREARLAAAIASIEAGMSKGRELVGLALQREKDGLRVTADLDRVLSEILVEMRGFADIAGEPPGRLARLVDLPSLLRDFTASSGVVQDVIGELRRLVGEFESGWRQGVRGRPLSAAARQCEIGSAEPEEKGQ